MFRRTYLKMPNKNYVKGRKKEYKICKQLRDAGYDIVQRTAGSHSPIDVIAIHKRRKVILLVQSKPDNYPVSKIEKLYIDNNWLVGKFDVEFTVI